MINPYSVDMRKFVVGVDEAGRGPLAGPVAVGVVSIPDNFNWHLIEGVNDSKKISSKTREALFCRAKELQKEKELTYAVSMVSASVIDRIGISKAVHLGIKRGLRKLELNPKTVSVKLDGLLKAPGDFQNQETIIKGDQKEKVIGLASIMAKVTRDRYIVRMAKKYPEYGLDIHKGYGTKAHRLTIRRHGLSDIHRRSFCRNIV